jgi:hypothetical protein
MLDTSLVESSCEDPCMIYAFEYHYKALDCYIGDIDTRRRSRAGIRVARPWMGSSASIEGRRGAASVSGSSGSCI